MGQRGGAAHDGPPGCPGPLRLGGRCVVGAGDPSALTATRAAADAATSILAVIPPDEGGMGLTSSGLAPRGLRISFHTTFGQYTLMALAII